MKKYLELRSEKNFIKAVLANIVTRIGDGIDMVAFSWLVYEITGSTVLTASIYGVNVIPNLTIGLISGVICQYISEKKMMFLCDIARAICVSVIAFLYFINHLQAWHLFVITFLNSSFEAMRNPCEGSLFPKILKKEHFELGMALKQTLVSASNFLGIMIAPVCISLLGLQGALFIDALSFALCGCIVLLMRDIHVTTESPITIHQCLQDLSDGFQYVKNDRFLLQTLSIFCLVNALFTPINSFEAAFMKDTLKVGSFGISLFSIGILLGQIFFTPFLPRLKERFQSRPMIVYGTFLFSFFFIAYAFLPYIPHNLIYISITIIAIMMGICLCTLNFPINIALYKRVDETYISRVQSICGTISMGTIPLAAFLAGAISHYVSIQVIYMTCAICFFIASLYMLLNKIFYKFNEY